MEHPDRIVRGQDGDGCSKPDAAGSRRDGGQRDLGRGDREVVPVVFTKPEEIDPDLISEDRLLDHVANDLILWLQRPGGIEGHISEGVEGEF